MQKDVNLKGLTIDSDVKIHETVRPQRPRMSCPPHVNNKHLVTPKEGNWQNSTLEKGL